MLPGDNDTDEDAPGLFGANGAFAGAPKHVLQAASANTAVPTAGGAGAGAMMKERGAASGAKTSHRKSRHVDRRKLMWSRGPDALLFAKLFLLFSLVCVYFVVCYVLEKNELQSQTNSLPETIIAYKRENLIHDIHHQTRELAVANLYKDAFRPPEMPQVFAHLDRTSAQLSGYQDTLLAGNPELGIKSSSRRMGKRDQLEFGNVCDQVTLAEAQARDAFGTCGYVTHACASLGEDSDHACIDACR